MSHLGAPVLALLVSFYMPFCAAAVHPTANPSAAQKAMPEFWREPMPLTIEETFHGPWGPKHAPDPSAVFKFERLKTHGNSPGLTVEGPDGVEWSVKQGREASVEVALSRVLSAAGYRQPPVFFLKSMALDHGDWVERAMGGRFRPKLKGMKDVGEWSWQENPFVGTKPYQGLLAVLMVFGSTDIKNSNNSLYEFKEPVDGLSKWFVVRDLGAALGETGRLAPKIADSEKFEHHEFIKGVKNGYVVFDYHGWHQELLRGRISPDDVRWACTRLGRLSDAQWDAVFRAGGFDPGAADRYIRRIKERIAEGLRVAG